VYPARFDYAEPVTVEQAVACLEAHADADVKVLAGGQSLIPLMRLRFARPDFLVDLNRIEALRFLRLEAGGLRIGALTREAELEAEPAVRQAFPILHDATRVIADPVVRNLATVGGNLAHGDPANDHPAVMLALGAEVTATGPSGERRIPIGEFFTGPFETALRRDELLTEIRVPAPAPRSGGSYMKLERKVGDFATAAVAAQVTLAADGTCAAVGIALTNVGLTPIKASKAEAAIRGKRPDESAIKEAAQLAADAAQPEADLRGSVEYKKDMVRVLTARALRKAIERAGGGR
jgi:aerobic carbon-monoxide dehydrogenase medium subunit